MLTGLESSYGYAAMGRAMMNAGMLQAPATLRPLAPGYSHMTRSAAARWRARSIAEAYFRRVEQLARHGVIG